MRIMKTTCRTVSTTSSSPIFGFGMRAKEENSSTMRLMSSTWRTIVSVHWSNTSRSAVMTLPYLRRMRSAESWIGVSGFLISWAMRRATSAQAEVRCAETRSVMSSRVMTKPLSSPRACSLVTRTLRVRSRPLREIRICCWTRRCRVDFASSIRGAISGSTASTGWPIRSARADAEQRLGGRVDDGDLAARRRCRSRRPRRPTAPPP